jgi:hypothetical protein
MTPGTNWHPDDAFLNRVKRAYGLATERFGVSKLSVWSTIFARQKSVHDALIEKDNGGLRRIFSDPVSSDLFYGVDNLCSSIFDPQDRSAGPGELRGIQQLANILGISEDDPDNILAMLDERLRQTVIFANPFRGEYGLQTSRGLASYRAIQALYQTNRIRELAKDNSARVLEIGPGTGRTAAYAFLSGIRDYTTIDLPMGIVTQACFLGATIGPDNLWMIGDAGPAENKIKLLPCKMLGNLTERFDIVFNADSLVEMSPFQVLSYLFFIRRRADVFLSMNHENRKVKVKHFAALCLAGLSKKRTPYLMREGYFEEVFSQ